MNKKQHVRFDVLCDQVLNSWPGEISIKERVVTKPGSIRFPDLIEVHDNIERQLGEEKNDLLLVMDWAIYKIMHKCSKYLNILHPHELSRDYIREVFEKDLFETEELSTLRREYDQT